MGDSFSAIPRTPGLKPSYPQLKLLSVSIIMGHQKNGTLNDMRLWAWPATGVAFFHIVFQEKQVPSCLCPKVFHRGYLKAFCKIYVLVLRNQQPHGLMSRSLWDPSLVDSLGGLPPQIDRSHISQCSWFVSL